MERRGQPPVVVAREAGIDASYISLMSIGCVPGMGVAARMAGALERLCGVRADEMWLRMGYAPPGLGPEEAERLLHPRVPEGLEPELWEVLVELVRRDPAGWREVLAGALGRLAGEAGENVA